jgi:outer membrane protein OmpA-like peptidoglycan-associated protein
VLDADRGWGRWRISGLRDPLAADPAAILASVGVDSARVTARWEPYLSADPKFVTARSAPSDPGLDAERDIRRERILFAVGSSILGQPALAALDRVAASLARLDSMAARIDGRAIVTLVGRSDPTGTDAANAALSRLRAQAARSALADRGVEPAAIEIRALGSASPLDAPDPAERSTVNRSVSFEVRVE